jgi:hypothetical protein
VIGGGACLQAKSHKAKRIRDNLFIRVCVGIRSANRQS